MMEHPVEMTTTLGPASTASIVSIYGADGRPIAGPDAATKDDIAALHARIDALVRVIQEMRAVAHDHPRPD